MNNPQPQQPQTVRLNLSLSPETARALHELAPMRQKTISALVEGYLLDGGLRYDLDDAIRARHEAALQRLAPGQQEQNHAAAPPIQPCDGPSPQLVLAATSGVVEQPTTARQGDGRVPDEDIPW